jgi:hypothetical protein
MLLITGMENMINFKFDGEFLVFEVKLFQILDFLKDSGLTKASKIHSFINLKILNHHTKNTQS